MGQTKIYNAIHFHISVEPQDNLEEYDIIKWILSALINQCNFNGEAIRLKKKKTGIEKEALQHFHFEVEILVSPTLTETDVADLMTEAFIEHCNFDKFTMKLLASHKNVVVDVDDPPQG